MNKSFLWVMSLAPVLLSACGGGSGSNTPAVTAAVPAAASSDSGAATTYVAALAAVPATSTDALEPVTVPDTLASSDTAEPAAVTE
jgi:hypothetical protein